jgi:type I restriction enzyme S subunit
MKISDIADIINITEKDPSNCGIDVFVGLEHYDIAEPVIKRFGSTKMLSTAAKKFETGDVLIARRNVYLQRASVACFAGLTSGDSIVLRVKKDLSIEGTDYGTMCKLLPFILNSINFWNYANTNADGTMSKRLSPAILQDYEFDLPSLDEQKALAEKLWAAYEVKQSYLKMIDTTQEMVKAQFLEMFGDPITNPKEWDVISMKESSFLLSDGPFGSNLKSEHYCEDGIRVIRLQNICQGYFDDTDKAYISLKHYENLKRYTCKPGEVVIGTLGVPNLRACQIPSYIKIAVNKADCVHYIPKPDLLKNTFVCAYINCERTLQMATSNIHGTTRARIAAGQLNNMPIYLPPIDMQEKYIAFENQADKSISELRKSIDAIDKVIKSLINENL